MANAIYFLPDGPKNLTAMFPGVDWNLVEDYYIEGLAGGSVLATSPLMKMGCCCDTDSIRIHFLNYLGAYDAINFNKPTILHETESSSYKKSLTYPLAKTDTGIERFNISANDTYEAYTNCYDEAAQLWVQELLDSPKAYLQWEGGQGQSASYLPIIILSKQFEKQKNEEEYKYQVRIQFRLSNEIISIRN